MANYTKYAQSYDYSKLRGRIKEKKLTEGEYARKIGRSHNFVSNVFVGKSYFETKDVDHSCEVLDIAQVDIGDFFYSKSSQNEK